MVVEPQQVMAGPREQEEAVLVKAEQGKELGAQERPIQAAVVVVVGR